MIDHLLQAGLHQLRVVVRLENCFA
ncbi:hypothetical protein CHELA17_64769 [Chelatococcus asaccharovorans]|nr:hypothetical protein CHELA17_64769 [Chelatococcus asaccharovorans]